MNKVYLDYAAAAPVNNDVLNAAYEDLGNFYNPSSNYEPARMNRRSIEWARKVIADEINCDEDEIIFTSGASEGNAIIINSALNEAGVNIIASAVEHSSILNAPGVIQIPVNKQGHVNVDVLTGSVSIGDRVMIQHANNEIGTIQDIKELSEIVHERGGLFHMDAAQTFGKIKIDVKDLGIDSMAVSGGKIGGIRGTGFLYLNKDTYSTFPISPLIYGTQEQGRRGGTEFATGIKCLGVAVSAIDYKNSRVTQSKRDYLMENLLKLRGVKIIGPYLGRLCNNIFISIKGLNISSQQLVGILEDRGFLVSAGSACHSGDEEVSHVLKALGLPPEETKTCVRITIGHETDVNDLDAFIESLKQIIAIHGVD